MKRAKLSSFTWYIDLSLLVMYDNDNNKYYWTYRMLIGAIKVPLETEMAKYKVNQLCRT